MDKTQRELQVKVIKCRWPQYENEEESKMRTFRVIATDHGTCKGQMSWRPVAGETLRLIAGDSPRRGWQVSSFTGNTEFIFATAQHDIPTDEQAVLRYACSITKGMGEAMADAIWAARHDDWRNVSSGEVPRLTDKILSQFRETVASLSLQRERVSAIQYLTSLGLTINMAESAWAKWGVTTIATVQSDCYVLANLPYYSFAEVDKLIRQHFGIADNDAKRIRAAVKYALAKLSQNSTLVDYKSLAEETLRIVTGVTPTELAYVVKESFGTFIVPFPKCKSVAPAQAFKSELTIIKYSGVLYDDPIL